MKTHDVDVLIVGLGPVGSVLALILAQQGINVAAIEAEAQGKTDLRASTFHSATLELLDDVGAADVILREGLRAPVYQFRDRKTNEAFLFDLGEIADVARFPFRLQCEQHIMAQDVCDQLERMPNVEVAYRQRLLFFDQTDTGVSAIVETPFEVERYNAKFLVGADGGDSTVRKLLEIGFAGFTYNDKYLCFSTEEPLEKAFDNLSYVNYFSDADEWMSLLRVPKLWRVLVPAPENVSDEDLLSDAKKDEVFRNILRDDRHVSTRHRTIYRVHQRVCSQFGKGRVQLVGDSAHLNSPIGGMGMNSGIHDAFNLAEKLTSIMRGEGGLELLDLYDRQRRTVTHEVIQADTIANTRAMREGWASVREDRRAKMEKLASDKEARRAFLLRQSMFTSLARAAEIQ